MAALLAYEDEITTFVPGIEDIRILGGLRGVQDHGTANFVEQPCAFEDARVFFKHLEKYPDVAVLNLMDRVSVPE